MRFLLTCVAVLLSAAWLFAQDKPENREAKNAAPVNATQGITAVAAEPGEMAAQRRTELPPNTPVVTVNGVCDQAPKGGGGKGCKTEVTRAQIEAVINALEPTASATVRRQLAINYARLVAAAAEAEKQHLDKDPEVRKELAAYQQVVRTQVLADRLYRQIEARAKSIPAGVVAKYYAEHALDFEQGEVWRFFLPKTIVSPGGEAQEIAVLKAKAEDLRARAAAGEDFDQLQEDAYREFGIKAEIPTTKLNVTRRMSLPIDERSVFDLRAGEVTPVMDTPNAFVVLKLVTKQSIPLASARVGIVSILEREHLQEEMRKATESGRVEFNLNYFGLPAAPDLFPPPQVTSLLTEQGTSSNYAQRTQSGRRPMAPHKQHEVTIYPNSRP